jgi:hypothetical protein
MTITYICNVPIDDITLVCNVPIADVTHLCNVVKGGGGGGVAFDNASALTVGEENTPRETPSWTLAAGAAVLALALAVGADDAVPASFKLGGSGGSDLTLRATTLTGAVAYATGRFAGIANQGAGGTTTYANWTGTPPQFSGVTSMSFTGCHATAPFSVPATNAGIFDETGGGNASVTLDTTPGRTVAAFLYFIDGDIGSPTFADGDANTHASHALPALGYVVALTQVAVGASTTVTVNIDGTNPTGTGYWEMIAVELIPV